MLELHPEISTISLEHYLILSTLLFVIGTLGVLFCRNVLVILMSIEIMLNAVNLSFVAFSYYLGNIHGQIMVFFVMTISAAEAGVGLVLIVQIFRKFKKINIEYFEKLKG